MYRRLACTSDWTPQNESNLKKHGVDFDTAVLVFLDPWFVMEEHWTEDGDTRWRTIGKVDGEAFLLVVHLLADEEDGVELVRIISTRDASPQERRRYESGL